MSKEVEYKMLRAEIKTRIKILHQTVNLAVILLAVFLVAGSGLYLASSDQLLMESYLLLLPLVFAGLTNNYQANQMTLEATARYLASALPRLSNWEEFYGRQKRQFELLSFLKTLPLFIPLTLPLVVWFIFGWPEGKLGILAAIDLLLLILIIFNFRYKAANLS